MVCYWCERNEFLKNRELKMVIGIFLNKKLNSLEYVNLVKFVY